VILAELHRAFDRGGPAESERLVSLAAAVGGAPGRSPLIDKLPTEHPRSSTAMKASRTCRRWRKWRTL
jgi:hypothetical protein